MNRFLTSYRLALTPLSPIHIGCGEDFEPTNYVIDQGVLFGFDPSRAVLNDGQRRQLMEIGVKGSWLDVQRFFRDNAASFKPHADTIVPVSVGVAQVYQSRIGKAANVESDGSPVLNRLFIERTSCTGPGRWPYVPGSSFKGALRTAIVDELNGGRPAMREDRDRPGAISGVALECRLLRGQLQTDPLRLFKPGDLMPVGEPARRIMYAVNLKKRRVVKNGEELRGKGVVGRKECITPGQYRAFVTEVVIQSVSPHENSSSTPAAHLQPRDLRAIARQSNAYNRVRLESELEMLHERDMVDPAWKKAIDTMLHGSLGKSLDIGDAFLIRLGRHGGAESKTLSGEGVAQIRIMQGKGQPPLVQSTTKTVWMAAERESDQKHLLPFGWAIVEIDPVQDIASLKDWCNAQGALRPDLESMRQALQAEREKALRDKAEMAAREVEVLAKKIAAQAAEQARSLALAQMSDQLRQVEQLRDRCEAHAARGFKRQAPNPGTAGVYQDATRLVKVALDDAAWSVQDKATLADVIELWLPRVISPWDVKEQRKKLRLAALRGLS